MYTLKRISPRLPYVLVAVVITTTISWLPGFENNNQVRLSDISWPDARRAITVFNADIYRLGQLAADRTAARQRLAQNQAAGARIAAINDLRDMDIIDIQMEKARDAVTRSRARIRSLTFEGAWPTDGGFKLVPAAAVPFGMQGDNRTWRIRVGDRPLGPDRVPVAAGGDVVGHVPGGLPRLAVPRMEMGVAMHLLPYALIISLLGFMEAISIAKAMAAKTGQRIDPNQELIGQGLANICGAFAGSYPTSGSFSRSAVNLQSGACTGLSGIFTGLTVVVVLIFFTPLLYHLPQSVLAAIIMMAVVGLINIKGVVHAWRAQWYDGVISVITFLCTLGFAPHLDRGILVGVVLSVALFLYKSMRPTVVDLSLGVDRGLHDAVAFGLKQCRYIDVVRFDGPLFFANAGYLEDQIRKRRTTKIQLKHIIIVANGINDVDASGEEALSLTVDRVRSAGIGISLSGVNEAVAAVFRRTHLLTKIGEDNIFPTMHSAITAVHERTHSGGEEARCPLTSVVVSRTTRTIGET